MEGESPMENEASTRSPAAAGDATTGHAPAGESTGIFGIAPGQKITPEERTAALRFIKAVYEDALRYAAMTEDDVEEEYRRAGKLHEYDPGKELPKRLARLAEAYPPPKFFLPKLEAAMKYLEDDDEVDEAPPSAAGT